MFIWGRGAGSVRVSRGFSAASSSRPAQRGRAISGQTNRRAFRLSVFILIQDSALHYSSFINCFSLKLQLKKQKETQSNKPQMGKIR